MIHLPSVRALARDIAHAAALGSVVAAVADVVTEAKHLRTLAAELTDANTRLRYERDVLEQHATRLMDANRDLCTVIRELTTLDPDDTDDAEYEPAPPVFGPAFIAEKCAEFRGQIEAWGGEVQ